MNKNIIKKLAEMVWSISVFVALLVAVFPLSAMTQRPSDWARTPASNVLQEVNCFDYYHLDGIKIATAPGKTALTIPSFVAKSGAGNVGEPKLKFVSIANYPLKIGAGNKVVACFSNENGKRAEDVRIQLSVLDSSGRSLFGGFYRGAVDGIYKGVAGSFASSQALADFSVKAELYQGSRLIDQATVNYGKAAPGASLVPIVVIILILIAIAFLILRLILEKSRKVSKNDNPLMS